MKIVHVFHHLNPFGGAEEHITSLAERQRAQGQDVVVCLVQATTFQNQYAKRLRAAKIPVYQWPLWLNRLSSDWDTREAILHHLIRLLTPLTLIVAFLVSIARSQTQDLARESVEGRLRTLFGKFLHPDNERGLFLLLLSWRNYWYRPDILHLHSYGAGLEYILEWANNRNIPTVYQEHSTPDLAPRPFYKLPTELNKSTICSCRFRNQCSGHWSSYVA